MNSGNFDKAESITLNIQDKALRKELVLYRKILLGNQIFVDFKERWKDSTSTAFNINLINRALDNYLVKGNEIKAFNLLKQSFLLAKKNGNKIISIESLKLILEMYQRFGSLIGDETYKYFTKEYRSLAYNKIEKLNCELRELELEVKFKDNLGHDIVDSLENLNTEPYPLLQGRKYIALSAFFRYHVKDIAKSTFYIQKAIKVYSYPKGLFQQERFITAKINLAIVLNEKKQYNESLKVLEEIQLNSDFYLFRLLESYVLYWKHIIHERLGDEMKSLAFYNRYLELELLNDQSRKLQTVSEYETKYQTAEKEKQLLIEQQEKKQNRDIAIGLGGLLLFGFLTFYLIQKNTSKKRKLAEQKTQLEQQKVATLLKDQELNAIDAMISGQEKERQRVANELHDDLGSLMATIKLHFDNIRLDGKDPALKSASNLLEKAYQKIRGIAHAKNSGVIAHQGLVPAINKMAKTISETNQMQFEVNDFGMKNRLENSLELSIFRIIQELITNIIKHAKATKASIQLTQHEDSINILVADNGQGFDTATIPANEDGIGLRNIEKRIEHLEGNFTIDSALEKGTSIIIDIPI